MLFDAAGKDCTDEFEMFGHSESAMAMLQNMYVGDLVEDGAGEEESNPAAVHVQVTKPAEEIHETMMARKTLSYIETELVGIERISQDTCNFVFQIQCSSDEAMLLLSLPPGSHIDIKVPTIIDGEESYAVRSYTPIRVDPQRREVTLLIKRYTQGLVSTHVHSLRQGDKMMMKGPIPSFDYRKSNYKRIIMISGGTGIAPMFQICKAEAEKQEEDGVPAHLVLLDANRTEEDILLRKELDELAAQMNGRLKLSYVLSQPHPEWTSWKGHINSDMLAECLEPLKEHSPCEFKVLICGSPGFTQSTSSLLSEAGVPQEAIHVY